MLDFWKTMGMVITIFIPTLYTSFGITLEHTQHISSTLFVFAVVGGGLTLIMVSMCSQNS